MKYIYFLLTASISLAASAVSSVEVPPLDNDSIHLALQDHFLISTNGGSHSRYGPISEWNTTLVTDMKALLYGQTSFNEDISQWDVSNVTDMTSAFDMARAFNGDIHQWNVSQVTNMSFMFFDTNMNTNLDAWDVSNVTNMDGMFTYARVFNQDMSSWQVSRVESMNHMFYMTASMQQKICWSAPHSGKDMFLHSQGSLNPSYPDCITLNDHNIHQAVQDYISGNANSFITAHGPISTWDTSRVTSMRDLFLDATTFNEDLSQWDVSHVTDMTGLFGNADSFNSDLNQWDVSQVTSMDYMFMNARSFQPHTLNDWNVSQVMSTESMFARATSFHGSIYQWDVSQVISMQSMFMFAPSFNDALSQWDVSNVTNMDHMFWGASSMNQSLCWEVSDHASQVSVFDESSLANGNRLMRRQYAECHVSVVLTDATIRQAVSDYMDDTHTPNADHYDLISEWDTSRVTNMEGLFYRLDSFNADIRHWDVSKVSTMKDMFYFSTHFNSDVSSWDVSHVTDMVGMFGGAWSFNGDISNWDVSAVTSMEYMFINAQSFNSNLGAWDVSQVSTMEGMFVSGTSFNSDIGSWDVSSVTNMESMFMYANSFDIDLNSWNVKNVQVMDYMFLDNPSFSQVLCWDTMASGTRILEGSSGSFSHDPACRNPVAGDNTMSPTPNKNLRSPTTTPTTPGDFVTLLPTPIPTLVPTPMPTIRATTLTPTMTPTVIPTASPEVSAPVPFYIVSGLSTLQQQWCLHPANHEALPGIILAIDECSNHWSAFKWTSDQEGKLINEMDPSLCITVSGDKLTLETCQEGYFRQMWLWNSNGKRIISTTNGLKGMAVTNKMANKNAPVRRQRYGDGSSFTDAEKWEMSEDFVTGMNHLNVNPIYNTFRIISQLSTRGGKQWCLFPSGNYITSGNKMAIGECKTWKSFLWMMDYQGRIINVKNTTMCIALSGKRMIMEECEYNNIFQRFAYSAITGKLVPLRNPRRPATVMSHVGFENSQVKFSNNEIPNQKYQSWKLDQF